MIKASGFSKEKCILAKLTKLKGFKLAFYLSSIYEEAPTAGAPGYITVGGRRVLVEN